MVSVVRLLSIVLAIVVLACAVSGQQPKRKSEPYIAPLLPAEQAWRITLSAQPAADAIMDDFSVYVPVAEAAGSTEDDARPLPAQLVALDRETGATRWTSSVSTRLPPVLTHGVVVVATASGLEALDPRTGEREWTLGVERPARGRMITQGPLLMAALEGGELIAVHLERREIVWRRSVAPSDLVSMTADAQGVYFATADSRLVSVNLSDGADRWDRSLNGGLSEVVVDRDRLFVGSTTRSFWSLDARTGRDKSWTWNGIIFGGAIIGAAVQGDKIYVVSWDNIVRALDRDNGAQQWKEPVTRPLFPPRVLNGIVAVVGVSPTLSTFRADNGSPVSTWAFPNDLLLQGSPLIDKPAPYRVSIVAVFRDGQVFGLRSTGMLFKEAAPVPLTTLPGRSVPRER